MKFFKSTLFALSLGTFNFFSNQAFTHAIHEVVRYWSGEPRHGITIPDDTWAAMT